MRSLSLLLDQMLDADVEQELLLLGYNVERVSALGLARAEDNEILAAARRANRVLVTLDEHFGDWAVLPLSQHPGVIRVKASPATTSSILGVLVPFLAGHRKQDFRNTLVIVRMSGVRWIKTG